MTEVIIKPTESSEPQEDQKDPNNVVVEDTEGSDVTFEQLVMNN